MGYLIEYGMFLAKAVTIVIAIVIIISAISSSGGRQKKPGKKGSLKVSRLNDHLEEMRDTLRLSVLDKDDLKLINKKEKKQAKADQKEKKSLLKQEQSEKDDAEMSRSKRVYVLSFQGNIAADAVESLREEITAVLSMAESNDEVLVRLESPGGMVHSYGLVASQLARIKSKGIPLTVVVDKVAASGGYLMASVADKILSAPFALIGSIGVVAQIPNVHKLLKKNDVDVELLTAGKYKRTLSVFGENTEEGREKFKEELEDVHLLFQEFVSDNRPGLDIDQIATGEAWYGKRALELKLVDALLTSDQYLSDLCEEREVYQIQWEEMKSPVDKILGKVNGTLDRFSNLLDGGFK